MTAKSLTRPGTGFIVMITILLALVLALVFICIRYDREMHSLDKEKPAAISSEPGK